jgi:two-component system LytT family response regulator
MRRAVIVDDEPKSIEVLKALVENFIEGVEIVGTANDIETAIAVIESSKPDLAFLDITLKEGDSFQILKRLKKIDFDVVFITAYDEYTTKALRYSGIHCLYKPIDISEFEEVISQLNSRNEQSTNAIEMARELLQSKFTRIPVITEKGLMYISPNQINYMEGLEDRCRIVFNNFKSLITNKRLTDLASVMESHSFSMVNSDLLINLSNIAIERTKPGKIVFNSGDELKIESEEVIKLLKMIN